MAQFLDYTGLGHFKDKNDALYAKQDGSYEGMTVGNAGQLVSTVGVEDSAPYTFRTTGGSADVGDRMNLKAVVGGTVAWNQIVQTNSASVTVPNAHKYLSRINGTNTIAISNGSAISINDGTKDNVFDLTAMFGSSIADYAYTLESGTAGAGIAWLKKYGFFTKPYYPYKEAALESVKTNAHKTVGFNQWDEEWESGVYNASGEKSANSDYIRSKYFIPVLPNTVYYLKTPTNAGRVCYYDASQTFINRSDALGNTTFTTPANCYYITFFTSETSQFYHNNICINLHWDGERDGEYEPYTEHTYALDDVELRGIPKKDASNNLYYDGDRYLPDGTVERRYGIVDLGSLTWANSGGMKLFYTTGLKDVIRKASSDNELFSWGVTSIGLKPYTYKGINHNTPYAINVSTVGSILATLNTDSAYSDATAFKTAMSGVYLVYELATPTMESADQYQQTQIVNDFGTEEFVDAAVEANERDVTIPVGHKTFYQNNLKAKLEMAPNSPDGDGVYVVQQSNGENEYIPLVIPVELPTFPSDDGTYVFKITVSGGTVTKAWVEEV